MRANDLTEGTIWKKLLQFFFPILFGMLFMQLYNTVDAIIVGRFVGASALAAVGGSPAVITNLVIGFFSGLASGATVVISQYYGAHDHERLRSTVHTTVAFCIYIGLALTVAGYFLTPWALRIVRTPADILEPSVNYLRIYFGGTVSLLIFDVGSGVLRAVGDSRRPLYFLITCCGLNIVLDLVFVGVLGWGIAGAGWATVISLTVSAVLILLNLLTTDHSYRLYAREMLRIDASAIREILRLGVPAGVQAAMYSLSNLLIQASINDLGTTIVAAWTASGKIDGIYWVTSNSFGAAICAFVGQCFGAGKHERMFKSVRVCLLMALGTSVGMGALMLAFGRYGFRFIVEDPLVIDYSVQILNYFVPFYSLWTLIEILSNVLRGAGDSLRPMLIVTVGVCALRVFWITCIVPRWGTLEVICASYPVSWAVTDVIILIYYLRKKWFRRCMLHAPQTAATEDGSGPAAQ